METTTREALIERLAQKVASNPKFGCSQDEARNRLASLSDDEIARLNYSPLGLFRAMGIIPKPTVTK